MVEQDWALVWIKRRGNEHNEVWCIKWDEKSVMYAIVILFVSPLAYK